MHERPASPEDAIGTGDFALFRALLAEEPPHRPEFASEFVDCLLNLAAHTGASDVHVDPTADSLLLRWRLDGVLNELGRAPKSISANVVARLKVLAGLLTYEAALPQEGRINLADRQIDVRLSTFPTLFGERALIRVLGSGKQALRSLNQLGLPPDVLTEIQANLSETTGAILIVGPAGSGKTTTAYACLRHIATSYAGGRSIVSLEDPIEVALPGIAQSQVNPVVGFDMASGLRSLLRSDPEVILIGEMRDRSTSDVALQAALTGQLVITTFHAGSCDDAFHRLADMEIAEYTLRNAIRLVVAQRLVRRLCECAVPADPAVHAVPLRIQVAKCWVAGACDRCLNTGYCGRALIAEMTTCPTTKPVRNLWQSATALVESGTTTPLEITRVLGGSRTIQ